MASRVEPTRPINELRMPQDYADRERLLPWKWQAVVCNPDQGSNCSKCSWRLQFHLSKWACLQSFLHRDFSIPLKQQTMLRARNAWNVANYRQVKQTHYLSVLEGDTIQMLYLRIDADEAWIWGRDRLGQEGWCPLYIIHQTLVWDLEQAS